MSEMDAEWINRYSAGYFDEHGYLRPEYVQRGTVEELARAMAGDSGLTRKQARRFFQHCRWLERRLNLGEQSGQSKWGDLRGDVYKLDIAAADALNKEPAKIPVIFHDFIKYNVGAIKTERDFRDGFMRHFEALIGFGYRHFKRE